MTIDEAMHICATEPINSERFRDAQQALIHYARRRALAQQAQQHINNQQPMDGCRND